jgi:hypothetical protein
MSHGVQGNLLPSASASPAAAAPHMKLYSGTKFRTSHADWLSSFSPLAKVGVSYTCMPGAWVIHEMPPASDCTQDDNWKVTARFFTGCSFEAFRLGPFLLWKHACSSRIVWSGRKGTFCTFCHSSWDRQLNVSFPMEYWGESISAMKDVELTCFSMMRGNLAWEWENDLRVRSTVSQLELQTTQNQPPLPQPRIAHVN